MLVTSLTDQVTSLSLQAGADPDENRNNGGSLVNTEQCQQSGQAQVQSYPRRGERNNFTLFPQNLYFTSGNVILISPLLAGWPGENI